jgi:hypothetical protein
MRRAPPAFRSVCLLSGRVSWLARVVCVVSLFDGARLEVCVFCRAGLLAGARRFLGAATVRALLAVCARQGLPGAFVGGPSFDKFHA